MTTAHTIKSSTVTLRAQDGHELAGYLCEPEGTPVGGLVVVQEIFGVNAHIREVAEGYARDGFRVIAPAMFDRVQRGVSLGYDAESMAKAMELIKPLQPEGYMLDAGAAVAVLAGLPTGIVGYCFGGSVAWRAADALPVRAAVSYYGSNAVNLLDLRPKCPVMAHFAEQDAFIPLEKVQVFRERHPEVEVFTYDADHGFNCDHRRQYHKPSAELARARSLAFLKKHLTA
jgi:carboxymethylenebutenolidase